MSTDSYAIETLKIEMYRLLNRKRQLVSDDERVASGLSSTESRNLASVRNAIKLLQGGRA